MRNTQNKKNKKSTANTFVKEESEKLQDKPFEMSSDYSNETKDATHHKELKQEDVVSEIRNSFDGALRVVTKGSSKVVEQTKKVSKDLGNRTKKVDVMNSKLKKQSVYAFNAGVARYEEIARQFGDLSNQLYSVRKGIVNVIRVIENQINLISNTPKSFHTDLQNINLEILSFKEKQEEIEKATLEVKAAKGGTGVGVTFSALGLAVATMGPSAAMSVATTFGVASTGTAISSLSGAAATNAALAWLGGGALSVGGGGMTSGAAFIALVGPVGFTIAGIMLTTSIGSGFFASQKNKEIAQKLNEERENLERVILKFERLNQKISAILETTLNQVEGVIEASSRINKADFSLYTREEKLNAGILVNTTLTLAQLVNKELSLDD